ncbi:MAG: AraC family transcriptional regulator [Alphaproteobacteria bacterium]|nr:AraC family transcriptional regulator [Alphaproteobacteria bacterium]
MPGGGTSTFVDAAHYEAALRQMQIEAIIVFRGKFSARLTWAELHYLQLLRCEEDVARAAYLHLAPGLVFVTFPAYPTSLPVCRGAELHPDDIIFHRRGERLHQSIPQSFVWNVIAVEPAQLERYSRVLSGASHSLPAGGPILQLTPRLAARLRRLHAQACRLAETKARMLSHPQVSRAIEQELIEVLVACLTTAKTRAEILPVPHCATLMDRFEGVLGQHLGQPRNIFELCELIGVSARALRACCAQFLGMSPARYMLLRRLREVRNALLHAASDIENVTEIAYRFGFAKTAHLTRTYRAIYGEAPSTTLQRRLDSRFAGS